MEWKYDGELCNCEYYMRGDKDFKQRVEFNKETETVYANETRFIRNDTEYEGNYENVRYSSKYGYFQTMSATLNIDDLEWMTKVARKLFKPNNEKGDE